MVADFVHYFACLCFVEPIFSPTVVTRRTLKTFTGYPVPRLRLFVNVLRLSVVILFSQLRFDKLDTSSTYDRLR